MTLKEYLGARCEATPPATRRWVMTLLRERVTQDGHEDAVETKNSSVQLDTGPNQG